MIYILDTSALGYVEQLHPPTMQRMGEALSVAGNEVVTTMISVDERISGRLAKCRIAKNGHDRVEAYASLRDSIELLLQRKWLPFTNKAAAIFDQLAHLKKLIGANDVAIAAITLSVNGILVTRNFADFERVPNLKFEDWAIENPLA